MYLIVGLGNPGSNYKLTRHNIGFEVIDKIASINNISLDQKKHKAIYGTGYIEGQKVILAKPQTYMNLSGESVRQLMEFYKLTNEDLIVIYDDTSLELGQIRIRIKGSAGGHNGIKSIIGHTNSQEFKRIKVGISEKPKGWDLADYVLAKFNKDEIDMVNESIIKSAKACQSILSEGIDSAMNTYNVK